jgi:hypothetical protein
MTDMETPPANAEILAKLIAEYIQANYPYVVELEQEIRSLQNGLLTFNMRVYDGKVQDLVIDRIVTRHVYGHSEQKK